MPSEPHGGTQGARDRRDQLVAELRPVVAEAVGSFGFDLDSLDVQVAGRRKLIKVVVDAEDGVELDLLSNVSKAVSAALDEHEDVLAGPYTLELTSPGVDRPLVLPRHWRRARLRLVRVHPHQGPEFTCRVGAADEQGVEVLVDGALRRIEFRSVARAAVEIEFRQPPTAELQLLDGHRDEGAAGEEE